MSSVHKGAFDSVRDWSHRLAPPWISQVLGRHKRLTLATLFLLALLLPLRADSYQVHILGYIGLFAMMGVGLNVVVGFAGLLDLGYVAFFAIGAYTYALLASPQFGLHIPFWFVIPVAVAIAALAGVLLGIPVLRMRGDYLAIVTLGFGEIIRLVLNNLDPVTRGPQGLSSIDRPSIPLISFTLDTPIHFYYLILIACVLSMFIAGRLENSRVGRAWVAMREDEDAAAAMGVDLIKYKLLAFAIGASFAGFGGVIFAARQGSIFPADFTLMVSINVLALVIIGGMGSIPGVVVGAIILVGLPEVLRDIQQFRMLVFGALLVAMMIFRPEGFISAARQRSEVQRIRELGSVKTTS
ncbi:MAG: ABC transporter ATP-binding protein [Chloroflexi bacterium]|nr:ABC transporter ATP-binding protein [Chloroflexota bacterium]MDA8187240.1 branched-chain amino acid ABC transporter permease [Dehalococcoidales bacterium]